MRPDARDRAGAIASVTVSILLALLALALVAVLWDRDPDLRASVAVVGGTVAAIASFLAAAWISDTEAVDPRALVMAGRRPGVAAWEALATSFVGIAPLCLLVAIAGYVALWRDDLVALAFAAGGGLVSWVLVITLARLGALAGRASSDRRIAGDVLSVTAIVLLLAASPLVFVVITAPWGSGPGTVVRLVADALAWSPFGGAWSAPAAASLGGIPTAAMQLGIAAATTVLLLVLWGVLGSRQAAGRVGRDRRDGRLRLGLLGALGRTPAGAIAARTVTYWLRDRRYGVVLVAVVFVPLLALVPLALAGVPTQYLALVPVPILAFFLGWSLHNDLAFDSTALWLHITASMRGRQDRLGRALPTLVVGVVLVLAGSAVTGLITGEWLWALSVLGASLGLLLAATGISSITSVLFPYPVARPGDSPFSQPVRSWGSGVWMHPVTGALAFLIAGPAIAAGVIGIMTGVWWWHLVALGAGLVLGAIMLAIGIVEGGRRYERGSSDLMTFATSA